jgi:VWFA-related protein
MRRSRLLLAAALSAPPGTAGWSPQSPSEPPRFAAAVEAVYVDALVARGGAPVAGLAARDFEVKDDGVLQAVELVNEESVPFAVVLVFDVSGSVQGEKLGALQAAGSAFLDTLRPASQIALVSFSDDIVLLAPTGSDREVVRHGLAAMRAEGPSAVLDALYAGLGLWGRARTLVVLFSDGEDNMSWLSADDVRRAAERSNALVHAIGFLPHAHKVSGGAEAEVAAVGPGRLVSARPGPVDPARLETEEPRYVRELRQIAEATGGRFWGAESIARIREAFTDVAAEVNARYVLRFEPKGARRPGWHRLDVRLLRRRKGTVRARHGYYVASPRD